MFKLCPLNLFKWYICIIQRYKQKGYHHCDRERYLSPLRCISKMSFFFPVHSLPQFFARFPWFAMLVMSVLLSLISLNIMQRERTFSQYKKLHCDDPQERILKGSVSGNGGGGTTAPGYGLGHLNLVWAHPYLLSNKHILMIIYLSTVKQFIANKELLRADCWSHGFKEFGQQRNEFRRWQSTFRKGSVRAQLYILLTMCETIWRWSILGRKN